MSKDFDIRLADMKNWDICVLGNFLTFINRGSIVI